MVHKRRKAQLYAALQLAVIRTTMLLYRSYSRDVTQGQVRARKQANQSESTPKKE